LQDSGEALRVLRRDEKVDMVGHQHIGMDVGPMPLSCGCETVEIAEIVIFGNKNGRAVIPALNHMLGLAGQKVPRESCHLRRLDTGDEQMDKSSLTPFFLIMSDTEFAKAFDAAKRRVATMDIRYVAELDPTRQALLEIYAATVLRTPYNDFENH
jgi:hypothetical protein